MKRAWNPVLWLVLAIPAAALLGGAWTLRAAQGDLSDSGQDEGARRIAQVQTAALDPDLAAARAGLSAQLRIDRARGEVRVRMPGQAAPAGLRIAFVHALQEGRDLRAPLQARDGEWVALLAPPADSRWHVQLVDAAGHWRLVGTLPRGADTLLLEPALPPP